MLVLLTVNYLLCKNNCRKWLKGGNWQINHCHILALKKYPDIDDKNKLKEWLNFIVTLKIKYKDTIEEIVSTLKEDKEKGRPKFIEFMKGFNHDVSIVAKQNLDLFPNLIPNKYVELPNEI